MSYSAIGQRGFSTTQDFLLRVENFVEDEVFIKCNTYEKCYKAVLEETHDYDNSWYNELKARNLENMAKKYIAAVLPVIQANLTVHYYLNHLILTNKIHSYDSEILPYFSNVSIDYLRKAEPYFLPISLQNAINHKCITSYNVQVSYYI